MPASVVKKGEEPIWDKAKSAAAKSKKKGVGDLSDDDYALVNYLFQQMKNGKECDEALSAYSAIHRAGAKKECRENSVRLLELREENGRKFVPCVIIGQGLGNTRDKNYYTDEAVKSGVAVYEGKQAYYDHPTPTEEQEQPGRSVRDLMGHYEDCKAVKDKNGLWELQAKFVPEDDPKILAKVKHAIEYKKKYPDKDYVGISINGDGEGETMAYEKFLESVKPTAEEMDKIKQVEGQDINVITKLTDAFSADFVTAAGARGRVLKESNKSLKRSLLMGLKSVFGKLFKGIEDNDKAAIAAAVKELREDEGDGEGAHEDEAYMSEAEKMHKALAAAKKEGKKYEGESEDEYEKRMMAADFKSMKKETESEDEDEDDKGDDGDGDGDHADADQDKAMMKKMKKENDALKAEVAKLKESNSGEELAKLKIKLESQERKEKVDKALAESGLPRWVTDHMRPVLEGLKTDDAIKKMVKKFQDYHKEHQEREFSRNSGDGFGESDGGGNNPAAGKNDSFFS